MSEHKIRPIEARWKNYLDQAVHPDAEKFQIDETEKAFYAGAQTMYKFIVGETLLVDADPVLDEAFKLEVLEAELHEFGERFAPINGES